jgi:hypothetical protein
MPVMGAPTQHNPTLFLEVNNVFAERAPSHASAAQNAPRDALAGGERRRGPPGGVRDDPHAAAMARGYGI